MTTASGLRGRASRHRPAGSRRRLIGSTAACKIGRTIRQSGAPGSTGRAAGNLPEARRAMALVPAAELTEYERLELTRLAGCPDRQHGGRARALERLVTIVHDSAALERLAVLAWDAGDHDRAREYDAARRSSTQPKTGTACSWTDRSGPSVSPSWPASRNRSAAVSKHKAGGRCEHALLRETSQRLKRYPG